MSKRNRSNQLKKNKGHRQAGQPIHVQIDSKNDLYTTIPKMIAQPTRDWTLRFVNTGAAIVGRAFTSLELASMLGLIATTATTSIYISSVFRLRRVKIWCLPSAVGVPCTVQAFWQNVIDSAFVLSSAPKPETDTSLSVDHYAFVELRIPKDSAVIGKWWNVVHGVSPLNLTAPPDAVVEFDFQWICDDLGTNSSGPALVGATPGTIYHKIVGGLTAQGVNSI